MKSKDFIGEFSREIDWLYQPGNEISTSLENLLSSLREVAPIPKKRRVESIYYHANKKFRFNSEGIKSFLGYAANYGVTFNYHQKVIISSAYYGCNKALLVEMLNSHSKLANSSGLVKSILSVYSPISKEHTLKLLHSELQNPTLTRKDSKPKERSDEILAALFSAYVYSSFPEEVMHELNDPIKMKHKYYPDYWEHLHHNHPDLFSRDFALSALRITEIDLAHCGSYEALSSKVLSFIQSIYANLTNHGYFAILIDAIADESSSVQWKLFSDTILYAEKHIASKHKQYFFKSQDIADQTVTYIPTLNTNEAEFNVLNRGFHYQDTFVIGPGDDQKILILFQKNEPDETVIRCPACRTNNVQGNSYSSLGVRSWECNNQFCPDRSKFNRGKRYSFLQILKQDAIEDERSLIPVSSVRKWARDVQLEVNDSEVLEMLVRHYSLVGDTVRLFGWSNKGAPSLDRKYIHRPFEIPKVRTKIDGVVSPDRFFNSSYFKRFLVGRSGEGRPSNHKTVIVDRATAILGDSFDVLLGVEENTFDGAVTSPPYYNAREYSQWDNIYTYLYDMYNINKEVYRVLKGGGIYLFNIFDYFDNERNVALSAMGDKRMILGAYIINIFSRIGFECIGNIVWDKGDIEGKRGFNNGNFSPYYQAPFNCWEHVFVFKKPGSDVVLRALPKRYLRAKPVIKIIRGENVHGHTAPFPTTIPEQLLNMLPKDSLVLDPFGGSMTTGIAAIKRGIRSVSIEMDDDYFKLGISKLKEGTLQDELI